MSARSDIVDGAVALIRPDKNRHAECVNAVNVALSDITEYAADLHLFFDRQTKQAKRAAVRLHKVAERLQKALADPRLPVELCSIAPPPAEEFPDTTDMMRKGETDHWLTMWLERIDDVAHGKHPPFRFGAQKKLIAAEQAYDLLQQFNRDISATEGSTFCRLAALLHGTPKANFQHPCRTIFRRYK